MTIGLPRGLAALMFLLLAARPLPAERYALLIGIGTYPSFPAFNLEAPAQDVAAMRDALIHTWQFQPGNVGTLVDAAASKANILQALDRLISQVKAGDQVFIYYSGHGTSAMDEKNAWIGLPLNTGALIPADVRKSAPAGILPQLIVGATDLKPRLRSLDAVASVFIVIDSCYSGAAVKSVSGKLFRSRAVPLAAMSRAANMVDEDYDAAYNSVRVPAVDADSYPYQHLIFLSAASQSQMAREASADGLRLGIFQTVDGKPHGLLTDSLLRAFRGEADENHDGIVTYEEVRRFALERVMNFDQTPQLLPANAPSLTAQPLFGVSKTELAESGPPAPSREGVTVSLSPAAQALAPQLAKFPEVRIAQGDAADLAIVRAGDQYELYIANGISIHEYRDSEVPSLLERVRREPQIERLRDWSFPKQAFHAAIDVEPRNRDAYVLGEAVKFLLSADRPSYLLLLNIDVSGEVTVVYKSQPGQPAAANESITVPTCIAAPLGTEYMKLFAFTAPPQGWASLPVTGFPANGPPFGQLMKLLQDAPDSSAQASWLTYSTLRQRPGFKPCPQ
jgi:hypothetical protein